MDKRIIAFIALIAVIVIMIGGYVISSSNSVESQISDITGSFDFSSEPVTSWDEDTHEYKFNQNVKTFDKKEFSYVRLNQQPRRDRISGMLTEITGTHTLFEAVLEPDVGDRRLDSVRDAAQKNLIDTFGRENVQIDEGDKA